LSAVTVMVSNNSMSICKR